MDGYRWKKNLAPKADQTIELDKDSVNPEITIAEGGNTVDIVALDDIKQLKFDPNPFIDTKYDHPVNLKKGEVLRAQLKADFSDATFEYKSSVGRVTGAKLVSNHPVVVIRDSQ